MEDYIYFEEDEEKQKKKKRRLILWLIFLIIFIIGSIISVVLVIAANQQIFNTDININYRTNNVAAEVSARYWTDNEKFDMYSGSDTVIRFDPREELVPKTLSPKEDIYFDRSIVFEYKFKNLSDGAFFNIGLERTPQNFGLNYTYNTREMYYYSQTELSISEFNALSNEDFSDYFRTQTINIGEGETLYVYIKVYIVKLSDDASYSGSFDWLLVNV